MKVQTKLTNIQNPTNNTDAANKQFIESISEGYLPLTGGTLTGVLDMQSNIYLPYNTALQAYNSKGERVNLIYIYDDNIYIGGGSRPSDTTILGCTNDRVVLTKIDDSSYYDAWFYPANDGQIALGTSAHRWYRVYATSSTIQTSDSREKKDIAPIGQPQISLMSIPETSTQNIYLKLFDELKPVQYRMINDDNKLCFGFLAQDIVNSMEELGLSEGYLDLIHHDTWEDEETGEAKDRYGIATDNLLALAVLKIQDLEQRIKELENK